MDNSEKKPNLKVLMYLIVGILSILIGFIAINEFTLQTGEDLYLKTVPVDPRDPLRGDYVILRYEFERDEKLSSYIKENNITKGDLYVSFTSDEDNNGIIESISETKPDDGIYILLEVGKSTWGSINYETGIGKYFVPEGTGRTIERVRSDLVVHTKVDKLGNAKIVDIYYMGKKVDPKTFNP